jgi:DNA-binding transcriptional regulator YdaS (Cro superfamily)
VPAERVRDVARITGLKPHELRPDLYPPPHPRKRRNDKRMSRELSSTA